jgi:hypothetical protein
LAMRLGIVGQVPRQGVASGFFRGCPTLPATGGMALDSGAIWLMSLTLAAVTRDARGMPLALVIRWCLVPGLARSTGRGPVASPP